MKIGSFWVYDNYIMPDLTIIELGTSVLEVLKNRGTYVEGRNLDGEYIYIGTERLVREITKEENPEYFL